MTTEVKSHIATSSGEQARQMRETAKLMARFGVMTDVQYADSEDKPAWYDASKTRFYRSALDHVKRAFDHWNSAGRNKPQFVLQLGDIIDGINVHHHDEGQSLRAIRDTLNLFEIYPHMPTFHAVGNHELYNFKRCHLAQLFRESIVGNTTLDPDHIGLEAVELIAKAMDARMLRSADPRADDMALYYKFQPSTGVKLIHLDCFEISVIGYDAHHPNYIKAAAILEREHGHTDWDGWDTDECLEKGVAQRYQSSNGAISDAQISWLESQLKESDEAGERVIVFGHVGLHPLSCDPSCLLWNYQSVLDVFSRHPCVAAYFCGHAHAPGYAQDLGGIHFVVFHGIIETPPQEQSFATVSLWEDRLEIEGFGAEQDRILMLTNRSVPGVDLDSAISPEVDPASEEEHIPALLPMPV